MRGKENWHHGNCGDDHLHSRDRVFVRATSKRSWFLKESKVNEIKIDDNNRKYYRVLQLTDDDDCKAHCFVDMFDGRVYKPRTQTTANKKYWWDLDECLKIADCHGYYLNKDPEENMPL